MWTHFVLKLHCKLPPSLALTSILLSKCKNTQVRGYLKEIKKEKKIILKVLFKSLRELQHDNDSLISKTVCLFIRNENPVCAQMAQTCFLGLRFLPQLCLRVYLAALGMQCLLSHFLLRPRQCRRGHLVLLFFKQITTLKTYLSLSCS